MATSINVLKREFKQVLQLLNIFLFLLSKFQTQFYQYCCRAIFSSSMNLGIFGGINTQQETEKLRGTDRSKKSTENAIALANANLFTNKLIAHVQQQAIQIQKKVLYQKYRFPASIDGALVHKNASCFGQTKSKPQHEKIICSCCKQNIETQKIPLCFSTTNVEQKVLQNQEIQFKLLSGISLFFAFIKMLIIYLLIRCIVTDFYNILTSMANGAQCQRDPKCISSFFTLSSGYNKYNSDIDQIFVVQDILNLITVLLSLPFFFFYRKFQYRLYDIIDQVKQTQDDFALFVQNIPILDFPEIVHKGQKLEFNYCNNLERIIEQKLKYWIQNKELFSERNYGSLQQNLSEITDNFSSFSTEIIKSIVLCFNLADFEQIQKFRNLKMAEHQAKYKQINIKEKQLFDQDVQNAPFRDIPNQIAFLSESQIQLSKRYANQKSIMFNMTHFLGKAFICFEYQHYREYIMDCYEQNPDFLKIQNHALKISRAYHPHDIFWQNLRVSDSSRIKKVTISYLIMLMTLTFAFGAVLGIDIAKKETVDSPGSQKAKEESHIVSDVFLNYGLTVLATVLILVVNTVLYYIIIALTDFQKHKTRTHYFSSLLIKLLISQFINTAIIYYIVTLIKKEDYLSPTGLITEISSLIVISGFIQIFTNALYPLHLYRKFMLWWNYRHQNSYDPIPKFQVNLNREFAYVQFDLVGRYSYYLLQIYTAFFYSYLTPIGVPALALIFFLQYWIDKYNLFNRSSFSFDVHFSLSRMILTLFEISIFVFALGNFIFSIYVQKHISILNLITLVATLFYSVFISFASQKVERKIFGANLTLEQFSYSDCVQKGKFHETYWKQNPATGLVREYDLTHHQNRSKKNKMQVYGVDMRNSIMANLAISRASMHL